MYESCMLREIVRVAICLLERVYLVWHKKCSSLYGQSYASWLSPSTSLDSELLLSRAECCWLHLGSFEEEKLRVYWLGIVPTGGKHWNPGQSNILHNPLMFRIVLKPHFEFHRSFFFYIFFLISHLQLVVLIMTNYNVHLTLFKFMHMDSQNCPYFKSYCC